MSKMVPVHPQLWEQMKERIAQLEARVKELEEALTELLGVVDSDDWETQKIYGPAAEKARAVLAGGET